MPLPATRRQMDLLRFIAGYQIAHHGVSPTLEECARAMGQLAKSVIIKKLRGLEERGWIRHPRYRPRAIQLLHPVSVPCTTDGAPLFSVPFHAPEIARA